MSPTFKNLARPVTGFAMDQFEHLTKLRIPVWMEQGTLPCHCFAHRWSTPVFHCEPPSNPLCYSMNVMSITPLYALPVLSAAFCQQWKQHPLQRSEIWLSADNFVHHWCGMLQLYTILVTWTSKLQSVPHIYQKVQIIPYMQTIEINNKIF